MTKNAKHPTTGKDPLFMPTRPPGTSDEAYAETVRRAANRQHQALHAGRSAAPRYAVPRSPWEEEEHGEASAANRQPPTRKAFVTLASDGSSTAAYID